MIVAQVIPQLDHARRNGADLLRARPTVQLVALAAQAAGATVSVFQVAHETTIHEQDGITYHFIAEPDWARVPGTQGSAGIVPINLSRAVRRLHPDVIHLNGLAFPLHARWLTRRGQAMLVQDHGDHVPTRRRAVHRWGYRRAHAASFTSRAQATPFIDAGVLGPQTLVFEIPESTSTFTPGNAVAARAALGIEGDPLVLWVGRLMPDKDPFTALNAIALAARRLPALQSYWCFQDAELLPEIRARIEHDAELARRVHLLGDRPHAEIEQIFRAADVVILPSRREGSSYTVIEALACGVTPIVSDIAALQALVGWVGRVCPVGDAAAFAEAILACAVMERSQLRARAREHFERELSAQAVGRKLLAAYTHVSAGHKHS